MEIYLRCKRWISHNWKRQLASLAVMLARSAVRAQEKRNGNQTGFPRGADGQNGEP